MIIQVFLTKKIRESDIFCRTLYNKNMDDKEYYSLMNRSSSWALQQALKKKNSTKKALSQTQKTEFPDNAQTFTSLELRQGKADAEMLMEKQNASE